jgi:hypothetical protein
MHNALKRAADGSSLEIPENDSNSSASEGEQHQLMDGGRI